MVSLAWCGVARLCRLVERSVERSVVERYQQEARHNLAHTTTPTTVGTATLSPAATAAGARDASARLLSRSAAALRLSCEAFPNSYSTQMELGRLLHEVHRLPCRLSLSGDCHVVCMCASSAAVLSAEVESDGVPSIHVLVCPTDGPQSP